MRSSAYYPFISAIGMGSMNNELLLDKKQSKSSLETKANKKKKKKRKLSQKSKRKNR